MEVKAMNCTENGCNGVVMLHLALNWPTRLKSPPDGKAFPCNKCGKLHWIDGQAAIGESGHKSFLSPDGKEIIIKTAQGKEQTRLSV